MSEESLAFRVAVLAADGDCVAASILSPCEGVLQAHHTISQQHLRKHGLNEFRWSPEVGAAVCERHHRRHHSGREPIRLSALPARCRDFAAAHGLGWVLDRYYA